jgi:hypothetical protein
MGHSPETPPVSAGGGDSKIHDFGDGYWEHTIVGKHAKWHYSTQPYRRWCKASIGFNISLLILRMPYEDDQ